MKIYFAGPLFSQAERQFSGELAEKLGEMGFEVFLPQRDGVSTNKAPYDKMPREERYRALFDLDRQKIHECDVFLFILDGRVPDEGACVELGMAVEQKDIRDNRKILIGLHTDSRAISFHSKLNPMIGVPLEKIFEKEEELMEFLKEYARK